MSLKNTPVLGVVVPCYNEDLTLPDSAAKLKIKMDSLIDRGLIDRASRVYFVDDGSRDRTWEYIRTLVESDELFVGIKLTRNCGHQYALYAGLMQAVGDCMISIDADLQDDIDAFEPMLEKYREGSEIVLGVRNDRTTDARFKRWTAALHYWLAGRFGMEAVPNHADFRLMSKRAIDLLGQYRERNLYLRGIVPLLGLNTSCVYYKRGERLAGETKYGLRQMLSLSVQGITSFSIAPLRIISILGLFVFILSTSFGIWALHAALTGKTTALAGWASTVVPIYLLGGLQLLAIGVAGEYIGKTYMEVKHRPTYMIEDTISHKTVGKDS
jgi:glycosyltransferase involved in cell wall biosynthesis